MAVSVGWGGSIGVSLGIGCGVGASLGAPVGVKVDVAVWVAVAGIVGDAVVVGLVVAVVVGLVVGLEVELAVGLVVGLAVGLGDKVSVGLAVGLAVGVAGGMCAAVGTMARAASMAMTTLPCCQGAVKAARSADEFCPTKAAASPKVSKLKYPSSARRLPGRPGEWYSVNRSCATTAGSSWACGALRQLC